MLFGCVLTISFHILFCWHWRQVSSMIFATTCIQLYWDVMCPCYCLQVVTSCIGVKHFQLYLRSLALVSRWLHGCLWFAWCWTPCWIFATVCPGYVQLQSYVLWFSALVLRDSGRSWDALGWLWRSSWDSSGRSYIHKLAKVSRSAKVSQNKSGGRILPHAYSLEEPIIPKDKLQIASYEKCFFRRGLCCTLRK